MSIFKNRDYKVFLKQYIQALPKRGHGEIAKIANHLDVNSALVSQIINGPKDFTLEQGHELVKYLGLSEIEADYFLLLLQKERAGTHQLKSYFQNKIELLLKDSRQVANRVSQDYQLDDKAKAIFYSSWMYTAARLLTSIEEFQTVDAIAERLQISRAKASDILRFLANSGLCVEEKGRYKMGPSRTHLEYGSPFLNRHHLSWRTKAIQSIDVLREDELLFTAPLTISRTDFANLRERILKLIQEVSVEVKDSKSEAFFCFNVDLFEVR